MPRALVLGYHDVIPASGGASGFGTGGARRYAMPEPRFRSHLTALAEHGVDVGRPLRRAADLAPGALLRALTFDDGGACALRVADLLEERGWRGYFFVVSGLVGRPGFVAAGDVRELAARGHVVGSHSYSHPSLLARLAPQVVRAEWTRSVAELADLVAGPVTTASVPGGSTSLLVAREAADTGVELLFTSAPTTRVSAVGSCLVVGRYQLYGTDTAATARAISAGRPLLRWRRSAAWAARRGAQRTLGPGYLRVRRALLG